MSVQAWYQYRSSGGPGAPPRQMPGVGGSGTAVCTPTLVALAILIAALAAACGHDRKSTTTPVSPCRGYWAQSSPNNVLALLRAAYEDRDIDGYTTLLADDFVFVFPEVDATPTDPTPAYWALADELISTQHMFADERVDSIHLHLTTGILEPADSVTYGPRAWKMEVRVDSLQVRTRNAAGAPLIYLVPGTLEVFYFRKEPSRLACDGRPSYFIVRWEDQPIRGWDLGRGQALLSATNPGAKTETITWGGLKARFR
jgi:hypothetical protein